MKRLLKVMALLVCASMFVFSCNNAADPDDDTTSGQTPAPEKPTETPEEDVEKDPLDLQLKINGQATSLSKSVASRAAVNSATTKTKGSKLTVADWKIEFGTPEDSQKINFYDYTDSNGRGGVVIEGFAGYLQGNYIDGKGNFSNGFRDYSAENGLYFPFVEPGKKTKLWLQGCVAGGEFLQGFVTLTPAHGYGVPDDLPDLSSYMTYDSNGNATLNNIMLTPNDYKIEYAWWFYDEGNDNKWASGVVIKDSIENNKVTGPDGNSIPNNYTSNYAHAINKVKDLVAADKNEETFQVNALKEIFSHDRVHAWLQVTFLYEMEEYDEGLTCPSFCFNSFEDTAKLYKNVTFKNLPEVEFSPKPKLNGQPAALPNAEGIDPIKGSKIDDSKVEWNFDRGYGSEYKSKISFYTYTDGNDSGAKGGILIEGFDWVQGSCKGVGFEGDGKSVYIPFVSGTEIVLENLQCIINNATNKEKGLLGNVTLKLDTPVNGYGFIDAPDKDKLKQCITYDSSKVTLHKINLEAGDYEVRYCWFFFDDKNNVYGAQIDYKDRVTSSGNPQSYTAYYKDALKAVEQFKGKSNKEDWEEDNFVHLKKIFTSVDDVYAWLSVDFIFKVPGYNEIFKFTVQQDSEYPIADKVKLCRDVFVKNPTH